MSKKNNNEKKRNTYSIESQTYSPFANLLRDNNKKKGNDNMKYNNNNYNNYNKNNKNNNSNYNNYNKNNKNNDSNNNNYNSNNNNDNNKHQKEEIYYLSYFLTNKEDKNMTEEEKEELKTENKNKKRDKNKVRKFILPLLISTVENKDFSNTQSTFKKDFSVIVNNKFSKFSREDKYYFIEGKRLSEYKDDKQNTEEYDKFYKKIENELPKKIDSAFNQAAKFLHSFKNIMMHKNIKDKSFSECKFKEFEGDLFRLLRISLEEELNKNKKDEDKLEKNDHISKRINYKKEYIEKVLKVNTKFEDVPFIFALSILAMFVESREVREVLDTIKLKRFVEDFILSFSLRGGYKTFVPGISLEDDELYLKQLEKDEDISRDINGTGKRLVKKINYFNVSTNKKLIASSREFTNYKNILRLYGYRNSFPKIDELEDLIKVHKAKELAKSNEDRMEGIRQQINNANIYNARVKNKSDELQKKHELKLETDYNNIKLTNVFRNDDIFMKESLNFLSSKYQTEFGKDTWSISGNTILWLEPIDRNNIYFDIRKKVKPSKNGLNSIYKIVYNKDDADKFSINRNNLRALITLNLISDMTYNDFQELKKTASNSYEAPKTVKKIVKNDKSLADILREKSKNWNRYEKASFILHVIRKAIIKDKHLHNRDSIAFHQDFMIVLYVLDNRVGNIYNDAINVIKRYGIDTNIPYEIKDILMLNTLDEMLDEAFKIFKPRNRKKGDRTNLVFKTWSKFAFLPCNEKNKQISDIFKWQNIRDKYNINNKKADLFDIWLNFFREINFKNIPPIVKIYNDYIKTNKINKYRNKEIRNIIVEEMILSYLSFIYLKNVNKKTEIFTLESISDSSNKNDYSPLQFDLVWKLDPEIRINIKDYNKKDIRNALNWIFNASRVKREEELQYFKGTKEDLNECLRTVMYTYRIIKNDKVLSKKAPKITYNIEDNILTSDNIKDIVHILKWAQKELLYFICNIEESILYAYNYLTKEYIVSKDVLKEREGGYFNFSDMVDFYNTNLEKIKDNIANYKYNMPLPNEIKTCRIMLSHGRIFDRENNFDYKSLIEFINESYIAIFGKSLKVVYNNTRSDFESVFNSIKEYSNKQKFIDLIDKAKVNSIGKKNGSFINSITISKKRYGKSVKFSLENLNVNKDLQNYLINFISSKLKKNKDEDTLDYCNLLLRTNFDIIKEDNNLFPLLFILIIIKDYVYNDELEDCIKSLGIRCFNNLLMRN